MTDWENEFFKDLSALLCPFCHEETVGRTGSKGPIGALMRDLYYFRCHACQKGWGWTPSQMLAENRMSELSKRIFALETSKTDFGMAEGKQ